MLKLTGPKTPLKPGLTDTPKGAELSQVHVFLPSQYLWLFWKLFRLAIAAFEGP